jgi:hypothetical protein
MKNTNMQNAMRGSKKVRFKNGMDANMALRGYGLLRVMDCFGLWIASGYGLLG